MSLRRALALAGALGALTAVAALPEAAASAAARPASSLRAFAGCPSLLGHFRAQAERLAGPWGLRGYDAMGGGDVVRGAVVPESAPAAGATPGVDHSGTNVQEAGVDEPDTVKTDGRRLFAVAGGRLRALDVSGGTARRLGSLPLPGGAGWDASLLLAGDRLLVLEDGGVGARWASDVAIAPVRTATTITAVDVSDPSAMRPVGTLRVDGDLVGARLTGTTVRAVIAARPDGPELRGPDGDAARALAAATARNRRAVAASGLGDWMPRYTLRRPGRAAVRRLAAPCDEVRAPSRFAGLGTVSVLTLGLDPALSVLDADAVMTDATEIYASTSSLYLATPRWHDPSASPTRSLPAGLTTQIHKLDTSDPRSTTYRASGAVPGHLLSQWAMSEDGGVLRVASTDVPSWWDGDPRRDSESFVTALAERDGRLVRVGAVGGIGRGERIYAVRFMGSVGYVVTFREMDPLAVVDLSDPTRPTVRGELHLPGYSAYLHPVADGLLLGVGQDAGADGRALGTQVSLFDVSDPARPTRVRHLSLGRGWSEAESDHHAFLYWPATGLLVLPFQDEAGFSGAVGLRVAPTGPIAEVGRVAHPGAQAGDPVRRSLVVGATLYTVSERGVMASALDTLAPRGWTPFA